jgi:hypothetical protein
VGNELWRTLEKNNATNMEIGGEDEKKRIAHANRQWSPTLIVELDVLYTWQRNLDDIR